MGSLVDPLPIGGSSAPSRVIFGSHVTNLGRGRGISDRHVAYYQARAAGGTGLVVIETASVHHSDWPYERAPLADECGRGWASVAGACHPHGTLVLAGLGHTGGQGSSAYSQTALWAPSAVADAVNREMPMVMERRELDLVITGFADAARRAVAAGLDGVEIDIGPRSLLRQFHSGLTNQRTDAYGTDRLRLTVEVIDGIRAVVGPGRIVALRLCGDELAPWAGITPDQAGEQVSVLAPSVDLITVVRGGPFSTSAERPGAHTAPGFNRRLCRRLRAAAGGSALVAFQGSVIDAAMAQDALDDGTADLVEMTRAQIADPCVVAAVRAGRAERIRPCILCNQVCQVLDSRNPLVSCIGEPRSGHETTEPPPAGTDPISRSVLVVGAGVAGLECARVLASRGHRVRVAERTDRTGGVVIAAATGPGRQRLGLLARWLRDECERHGVSIELERSITPPDLDDALSRGEKVVLATGGRAALWNVPTDAPCTVIDVLTLLGRGSGALPPGPVVVDDPVGGPVGVAAAEWLAGAGRDVALVTPDPVAGTLLSLSGDLAGANTRLQQAGVRRVLRSRLRKVSVGKVHVEHVLTGATSVLACAAVVDCGHRLPDDSLAAARPGTAQAGDCVAPRTVLEAVLEGRRRALDVGGAGRSAP